MIKRYFWFAACVFMISPSFGQLLNWQAENIVTDRREVGANPASILDDSGNLHVTFWNSEENRLYYGVRDRSNGMWSIERVEDSAGGHKSALVLDAGGNVHVAYLAERSGQARIRYARKSSGSWAVIEGPSPRQNLGVYGPDIVAETNVQHSVDIRLAPDGEPIITYFDGTFSSVVLCNGGSTGSGHPSLYLPGTYDFDGNVARRLSDGSWEVNNLDYPLLNPVSTTACTPLSGPDDRFGEFGTLLSYQNDTKLIWITNSFYNHQLVAFTTEADSLERWESSVLDSASRFMSVLSIWPEDAFGFIDAAITGDTMLHVVYNMSQTYGKRYESGSGRGNIRNLLYINVPIASLGNPALPGLQRHDFVLPPRDDHFRAYAGFAALNSTVAFAAHYDESDNVVVMSSTGDGGVSWIPDTVFNNIQTDAQISLNVHSDSVYMLTYEASTQKLLLAAKSTGGSQWRYETLTITEKRGLTLAGTISPEDKLYLATPEPCAEQLQVAVQNGGSWQIEEATPQGDFASEPTMVALSGDSAMAAFVEPTSGKLRFTIRSANGTWTVEDITTSGRTATPSIVAYGDSVWVVYTDVLLGNLRMATSEIGSGQWTDVLLDNQNTRTGVNPVLRRTANQQLHVVFKDQTREVLRYGMRSGGNWTISDITPDTVFQVIGGFDLEINEIDGKPYMAYVDDITTSIYFLSQQTNGLWDKELTFQTSGSQIGSPLDLVITETGNPWLLFSYNVGGLDMRLLRKNAGSWQTVSLTGNTGQIAGSFNFLRSGRDLYILGRKNRFGEEGLGMISAEEGAAVNIDATHLQKEITLYPNPANLHFVVDWGDAEVNEVVMLNLAGQLVKKEIIEKGKQQLRLSIDNQPSGLYLIRIRVGDSWIARKVMIE